MNVEGRQTKDGTPIIVWFDGAVNPPDNNYFYIYYEGNAEAKLQNTTNAHFSDTKFKLNGEVFAFADARKPPMQVRPIYLKRQSK